MRRRRTPARHRRGDQQLEAFPLAPPHDRGHAHAGPTGPARRARARRPRCGSSRSSRGPTRSWRTRPTRPSGENSCSTGVTKPEPPFSVAGEHDAGLAEDAREVVEEDCGVGVRGDLGAPPRSARGAGPEGGADEAPSRAHLQRAQAVVRQHRARAAARRDDDGTRKWPAGPRTASSSATTVRARSSRSVRNSVGAPPRSGDRTISSESGGAAHPSVVAEPGTS